MPIPGSNSRADLPLAVVVGAGGMGAAVARRLGQTHRLMIADRDIAHCSAVCAALGTEGHDAAPFACDVTRAADVARLAAAAAAAGPVRTLANVVGLSVAADDFGLILEVNLVGAARMAEEFHAVLAPGGCAVFVSSCSAHLGTPDAASMALLDAPLAPGLVSGLEAALGTGGASPGAGYMFSKVGLNRMCRRLAPAWGKRGLRIVSLSPGLIATPMGAEAYRHSAGKRAMFDAIPLGREGTMIEIAGVIDFLASPAASFISGTDILVDGGMIAAIAPGA